MTHRKYRLWTVTDPREDDPREYLDIIILNAKLGKVQALQYGQHKVFVISEEQYNKLLKN